MEKQLRIQAVKEYLMFKTKQYTRMTGFDHKQESVHQKLKEEIRPLLKGWVAEAIAAGAA